MAVMPTWLTSRPSRRAQSWKGASPSIKSRGSLPSDARNSQINPPRRTLGDCSRSPAVAKSHTVRRSVTALTSRPRISPFVNNHVPIINRLGWYQDQRPRGLALLGLAAILGSSSPDVTDLQEVQLIGGAFIAIGLV